MNPKFLEILICPVSRGPLFFSKATSELISPQSKLAYPVKNGIPIMLPDEARTLDELEIRSVLARCAREDDNSHVPQTESKSEG